jgi:spore coat protein U-like protein
MFKRLLGFSVVLAAGTLLSNSAALAATTGSLGVSASVTDNCLISNTPAVAFGSYDPVSANASANVDQTGTISLTCTNGAVAVIALDAGANGGQGTGTSRAMKKSGASNYLNYELYSDSGRSTVWSTGAGAVTETATTSDAAVDYTVYGRIPSGQDAPAGTYGDTVGVTVTF